MACIRIYLQQLAGTRPGLKDPVSEQLYLQTNETTISFYGKLSEVQKKPCFAHFVPIHKSYVVNPDYIDHISANTVYLQGKAGEQLPISRTYQPLVEKWLMQH